MNCWVCGGHALICVRDSKMGSALSPEVFRISDSNYGVTGTLFRCSECTFLQCFDFSNSNEFYYNMVDNDYEASRDARKKEMLHILDFAERTVGPIKNILDIGAGSGIFVEVASISGYTAVGLEPSKSLVDLAKEKKLKVHLGTFPNSRITGEFDLITLIDVIEHLNEPSILIGSLEKSLSKNGTILISTPDVSSKFAKLMKWNWWHFRVAHIGYFDLYTLDLLMKNHGYRNVAKSRPLWYFNADYLFERIALVITKKYFSFRWLRRFKVRVNLHDSILCAYQKI
jgi:2-polyprenyl-3-methyl-5-hydroxy-6-metoxy-1,4-benzoquinol methylase